jgi:hypothetical protein
MTRAPLVSRHARLLSAQLVEVRKLISSHATSSRVQINLGLVNRPSDHLQVEFASDSYLTEDVMIETKDAMNAAVDAQRVETDQNVDSLVFCYRCGISSTQRQEGGVC